MTAESFASDLFARLTAERAKLDGKPLSRERWLEIATEAFRDAKRKKPKDPATPRRRDVCFDALALVTGYGLDELGQVAGKTIGSALADIRRICPKVTSEEIKRRGALIVRKYEKAGPFAVAGHWSEFPPPRSEKPNVYVEPENWHPAAIRLFGEEVARNMIALGWAEIRTNYGMQIIRAISP